MRKRISCSFPLVRVLHTFMKRYMCFVKGLWKRNSTFVAYTYIALNTYVKSWNISLFFCLVLKFGVHGVKRLTNTYRTEGPRSIHAIDITTWNKFNLVDGSKMVGTCNCKQKINRSHTNTHIHPTHPGDFTDWPHKPRKHQQIGIRVGHFLH